MHTASEDWQTAETRGRTYGLMRLITGLAMVACLIPGIVNEFSALNRADARREASVPLLSQSALLAEIRNVQAELKAPPTRMSAYFRAVKHAYAVEAERMRFENAGGDRIALAQATHAEPSFMSDITVAQQAYLARFGYARLQEAAVQARSGPETSLPVDSNATGRLFVLGYLLSIAFAAMFFAVALLQEGMNPLVDLDRVLLASLAWPYAAFKYPSRLNLAEQLARAKRRVGSVLAAMLSFAPVGAIAKVAGENSHPESEGRAGGNTIVLDDIPLPKISFSVGIQSIKVGGNGVVLHDGAVATWDAHADYAGGWSLDWSGTRSLGGLDTSDETDYALSKSGELAGVSYSASMNVYDIRPMWSAKGGDFLAPAIHLAKSVGHGISLFANAEYDHVMGHGENNGYTIQVGLERPFHLDSDIIFDQSVSLVHAKGPFGLDSGSMARYDASLSFPVAGKLRGSLWLKAFAPTSGAKDRKPDAALGFGLSYAAN